MTLNACLLTWFHCFPFQLDFSLIDIVLTTALLVSLGGSLVVIPLLGFNFKRIYGFYLYGLYAAFLVMVILVETSVITDDSL